MQYKGQNGKGDVVIMGFPFETITNAAVRAEIMDRVLEFFELDAAPNMIGDANGDGTVDGADSAIMRSNWLKTVPPGAKQGDFNGDGIVNDVDATLMAANWLRTYR